MANQPVPGVTSPWGSALVAWLNIAHNADGTLKTPLSAQSSPFSIVPLGGSLDNVDFQFRSDVAGTAQFRVNSRTANTPGQLVGGIAVARNASANTVVGIGWQTGDDGTWDLDMGTAAALGGYSLNLSNKNVSGTLQISAGAGIKLGIGTGEWDAGAVTEYFSIGSGGSAGRIRFNLPGPHAIGTTPLTGFGLYLSGNIPQGAGAGAGLHIDSTINPAVGADGYGLSINPTLVEAASGTHAVMAGVRVAAFTLTTAGGGVTTDAASLYVAGAPSGATNNAALLVAAGSTRFGIAAPSTPACPVSITASPDTNAGSLSINSTTDNFLTFTQSGSGHKGAIGFASGSGTLVLKTGGGITGGTTVLSLFSGGGLNIGSPTGGDPGAGKINIAGAQGYQVNGTPIAAVTLKSGTGAGDYTTASASYVDVDGTNLAFTVTIPNGFKLLINAACSIKHSTLAATIGLSLFDGATVIEEVIEAAVAGDREHMGLTWAITGDGASHTVKLQWKTSAATATMNNASSTLKPAMTFLMVPSA